MLLWGLRPIPSSSNYKLRARNLNCRFSGLGSDERGSAFIRSNESTGLASLVPMVFSALVQLPRPKPTLCASKRAASDTPSVAADLFCSESRPAINPMLVITTTETAAETTDFASKGFEVFGMAEEAPKLADQGSVDQGRSLFDASHAFPRPKNRPIEARSASLTTRPLVVEYLQSLIRKSKPVENVAMAATYVCNPSWSPIAGQENAPFDDC